MGEGLSRGTDAIYNWSKRDIFLMDFRSDLNFWGLGIVEKNVFLD